MVSISAATTSRIRSVSRDTRLGTNACATILRIRLWSGGSMLSRFPGRNGRGVTLAVSGVVAACELKRGSARNCLISS
jgi:hypothetical protein